MNNILRRNLLRRGIVVSAVLILMVSSGFFLAIMASGRLLHQTSGPRESTQSLSLDYSDHKPNPEIIPVVGPTERIPSPQTPAPATSFQITADDQAFYIDGMRTTAIAVPPGANVQVTFTALNEASACDGLMFGSEKFDAAVVGAGGSETVSFVADSSVNITSYCIATGEPITYIQVIFG